MLIKIRTKTWMDKEIEPGTRAWEDAIRDAIAGSFAIILIASPNCKEGPYVRAELLIAESNGHEIFPIWIDGYEWIDSVPIRLSGTQFGVMNYSIIDKLEKRFHKEYLYFGKVNTQVAY